MELGFFPPFPFEEGNYLNRGVTELQTSTGKDELPSRNTQSFWVPGLTA